MNNYNINYSDDSLDNLNIKNDYIIKNKNINMNTIKKDPKSKNNN